MGTGTKMKYPPASFWTSIIAVVAIISAVAVFIEYFTSKAQVLALQAQELESDQKDLRVWTGEISDQVDKNAKILDMLITRVDFNAGEIAKLVSFTDQLAVDFSEVKSDVSDLAGYVTVINGDVTTLKSNVAALTGNVTALTDVVVALDGQFESLVGEVGAYNEGISFLICADPTAAAQWQNCP